MRSTSCHSSSLWNDKKNQCGIKTKNLVKFTVKSAVKPRSTDVTICLLIITYYLNISCTVNASNNYVLLEHTVTNSCPPACDRPRFPNSSRVAHRTDNSVVTFRNNAGTLSRVGLQPHHGLANFLPAQK